MTELKRCPFCGSEPEVLEREREVKNIVPKNSKLPKGAVYMETRPRKRYVYDASSGKSVEVESKYYVYRVYEVTVTCSNSKCMARSTERRLHTMEDALARWNRRAGDVPIQDEHKGEL